MDRSRLGRSPEPETCRRKTAIGHNGRSKGWRIATVRPVQVAPTRLLRCPVEEHPYRTAECTIDEALIERLEELTRRSRSKRSRRRGRSTGAALATLRRQAADARSAGNHWMAFRKLGEIIAILGEAGRFFRKNNAAAASLDH